MVSTALILLKCYSLFLCVSYAAKIERDTKTRSDTVARHRRDCHSRFKRIVNLTDVKEISVEDHNANYPFIIGIKTLQLVYDGKQVKKMVRCTGTMLSAQLVLTTSYCVRNAITMKVYKRDNPGDNNGTLTLVKPGMDVKIRSHLEANKLQESGDQRIFPNPLFYGDLINRYNKWHSMYQREDARTANVPMRNVAIVFLEKPLLLDNETTIHYPIIDANPSRFFGKNRTVDIFGWCQIHITNDTDTTGTGNATHPTKPPKIEVYETPRLTMVTVQVSVCELDTLYQHFLCVERAKYKDAFCELDQGGPLILQGGEDDKKPTQLMMMKKYQRIIAVNSKNHKIATSAVPVPVENMPLLGRRQGKDDDAGAKGTSDNGTSSTPDKKPPPSLIGMVNTDKTQGYLTYLWPYADWIYSMMYEYGVRPTAMPMCPTTPTTERDVERTMSRLHIESYYDYLGMHGDSKQVHDVDVPCRAPTAVPEFLLQLPIAVAYVIGGLL